MAVRSELQAVDFSCWLRFRFAVKDLVRRQNFHAVRQAVRFRLPELQPVVAFAVKDLVLRQTFQAVRFRLPELQAVEFPVAAVERLPMACPELQLPMACPELQAVELPMVVGPLSRLGRRLQLARSRLFTCVVATEAYDVLYCPPDVSSFFAGLRLGCRCCWCGVRACGVGWGCCWCGLRCCWCCGVCVCVIVIGWACSGCGGWGCCWYVGWGCCFAGIITVIIEPLEVVRFIWFFEMNVVTVVFACLVIGVGRQRTIL